MPRPTRSISVPIVLASVTVVLAIALIVGWVLVISQNLSLTREALQNTLLLIAGIVSLVFIGSVMVMFSVFLVREILEVRRQNSFIDSVTHELKSPLASLKLCLETLPREELTAEQREELRGMMLDDVERLSLFIDDILEASRLAHGQGGHLLSEVLLSEMAGRCAEAVLHRHKAPPEAITVRVPAGLTLHTDATALELILKNLLDNAVKYSEPPIRVELSARLRDEKTALIEVRDQGIGISKQHLKRVFERFYRVPSESVHQRRGTGLGLYVVLALVRSLGGRIEAHSEGPGHGASMRVHLPLEGIRGA
jgi:signal transduction histidine kinase